MGMERKAAVAAVLLAVIAGTAHAGCKELAAAIDASMKEIADKATAGIVDNSAPREAVRQTKISNELAAIQVNLVLAAAAKCAMPSTPIDTSGGDYQVAALQCNLTLQTKGVEGDETKKACDRSAWSAGPKKK